jgi:hypothetical protein
MRLPASEKLEIIRLVEQSHLPARRTLKMLGIKPSTFSIAGMIGTDPAGRRRSKTSRRSPIGSGTAFPMMFASALS